MENGKLVRKNVAAGRRLRPLRHTRQMSTQPTNDDSIDRRKVNNDKLNSIDAYIEHVSLENGTNDNNHTALHSALQSLKGRVHHARTQSVKRSQSKQRQGDSISQSENHKKFDNTNTSFASTTTPKTCSVMESVMPPRNDKHHLHKTNSVVSNGNIVSKEFLSASMPLHNMKDNSSDNNISNNNVGRIKLRRSNNNNNNSSKQAAALHVKEHNARHDKTTETNNTKTMTNEEKENKISSNTNRACHARRNTPTIVALQKRSSVPEKSFTHTTNEKTDYVLQNEIQHEYKWEQVDKKNDDDDDDDKEINVVLPLAPHDMDEEYYTNKANWEINLPEYVIQLLESEKLMQPSQYHEEERKKLLKEKENAENDYYHNVNENKLKSGYFACIRCHTPICALHNQIILPQTLSPPLLTSYNTNNVNERIESNDIWKNQEIAFRCIDHHAITLTLSTAIHGSNTTNNNCTSIESKKVNNEQLHIMVHCVHCNGCLGELITMYDDSEREWEMNDTTYVYVAQRACLQYMPFRTQHELDTPIDLMLCCNDNDKDDDNDEYAHDENKVNKQRSQKKYNSSKNRKEVIDVPDDELFQLSWHSSDMERDVFYSIDDDESDDNGYM